MATTNKEMTLTQLFLLALGIFLFLFTTKITGDWADDRRAEPIREDPRAAEQRHRESFSPIR